MFEQQSDAGEVPVTALLQESPGLPGVSRADAAGFILEGVRNTLRGEQNLVAFWQGLKVSPSVTQLQCL